MFLTQQKLRNRIQELEPYRYRDLWPFSFFSYQEDESDNVNPPIPKDKEQWRKIQVGDPWRGRDQYLWLHREVVIPTEWKERKVVGIFDFGITGGGNNSGFESLLYINGVPFQGVDANHKEVFLRKEWIGEKIEMTFRLWSGLEGGGIKREQEHRINRADLAFLDEKVDDFYYTAKVILETIAILQESAPQRIVLQKILNQSMEQIDWSYPGSDSFYQSIYSACSYLKNQIEEMGKNPLVHMICIGHTHIDVAWLWRLKHTREKIARSFSTVLRLME